MNDPPKDHKVPLLALDNLYLYPLYCGTYFLKTSFDVSRGRMCIFYIITNGIK